MSERLTFEQFDELVTNSQITDEQLYEHIELDPSSKDLRPQFRPGGVTGVIPEDYNLSERLIEKRNMDDEAFRMENSSILSNKPVVLMDGDSWFDMPWIPIIAHTPDEIGDWLMNSKKYRLHRDSSEYGDTIKKLHADQDYIEDLTKLKPDVFLISGGGNDIKNNISTIVHDFDSQLAHDQYLTDEGYQLLDAIKATYHEVITEANSTFYTSIVIYGYDYPRPKNRSRFIGQYLQAKGIPEGLMAPITDVILDRHNKNMAEVASQYENVMYVNCLNETDNFPWHDDLHPNRGGFKLLADIFMGKIDSLA